MICFIDALLTNASSIERLIIADLGYSKARLEMKLDLFWTIAIVLVVLWILLEVTTGGLGGLVYLLLVIALVIVVYRLFTGRNVVTGK